MPLNKETKPNQTPPAAWTPWKKQQNNQIFKQTLTQAGREN